MIGLTPSRDDTGTTRPDRRCAGCGQTFTPTGRQLHCSPACRKRVFRSRRSSRAAAAVAVADAALDQVNAMPDRGRREHTVYECPDCGNRQLGTQRCADCGRSAPVVGLGGACPGCDQPVTLADLGLRLRVAR
ncbi:MAG: hypothetical protein ACRDS1_11685 [Pseudonocardiaceae bacterium]